MSLTSELRQAVACMREANRQEIAWAKLDRTAIPYVRDASIARRVVVDETLSGLVITDRVLPCDAIRKVVGIAHTFASGKCVSEAIRNAFVECERVRGSFQIEK